MYKGQALEHLGGVAELAGEGIGFGGREGFGVERAPPVRRAVVPPGAVIGQGMRGLGTAYPVAALGLSLFHIFTCRPTKQ